MVTKVEDPSKYGVVVADSNHKIEAFVEKPSVFVSDQINAGLYLFNLSMINRIENRPTSIEREIFPVMASEGQIYQMKLPGYWMDIGQPKDYLKGQQLHIK
jgi:mannose-1-phosphate guanylyltransferase